MASGVALSREFFWPGDWGSGEGQQIREFQHAFGAAGSALVQLCLAHHGLM